MRLITEIVVLRKIRDVLSGCGIAALVLISLAAWACAGELPSNDAGFLKSATENNLGEIALGKLALEKSARPDIKMFAQQIVTDHEKANQNLKALAASKNLKLPDGPGVKNDAKKMRLQLLSGRDFDNGFVNTQVDAHKIDIGEYEKQSGTAVDSDVKKFASQTLPILKEHLKMVETIQGQMVTPGQ
jgi:putative membrane protein